MKRIFSILLALAMILSLLPMGIGQAKAAEVVEGDGTSEEAPVLIDTEEEWVYYLNNSTGFAYKHETQQTWYFRLTADIVLDAADEENGDTVNGAVGYTSTGKTTVIDLNGFTVTANGGTARFMAANSAGSSVTMKNGSAIINRTGTSNNGSVFFINNGSHLTLENMTVTETGTSEYTGTGEFLYIGTNKSSATIKNTVIEADTTNSSKDNAIYVNTGGASLDVQDSTINETVHVTTTGIVSASGVTKISKLNLAYTASAQAKAELSGLSAGARVRVAAGETAFTEAFENAEGVLSYVKSADVTKKVAVSDNALVLVAEETGDGSAEKPWLITSEADYVKHIFTNTTESGYYKLKDNIVLDVATDDDVNGNQNGSATGRTICIDLDGYTISTVGTGYRFFSCGAEGELTLKNGAVIVDRTYKNSFGAVFNILNGGKLTLENMNISEIGTVAYEKNGELLSVTAGSTAVIVNTVMDADTTNNTNDNTVHISESVVAFENSEIPENVYASADSTVTVTGTTKIANIDLTSGALLTVGVLTEGAQIGITAEAGVPFTGVLDNAADVAACFTTEEANLQVGVLEDSTLALIAREDGTGATESDPIYINSDEEWIEYLVNETGTVSTSQQTDWYFVLMTDLRIRTGAYAYGATGKNITIDFNGHTMNSANGATLRFMTVVDGSLTMKNGTLEENGVSTGHGAVFHLTRSDLILTNMQVDEYSATAYTKRGEIIYSTASDITLTNTHITGVFTGLETDYGAIYLREETATATPSTLTMVNSSLSCTETGTVGKGGWITAGKNTAVVMENSAVSGGAAAMGGNVYVGNYATLTMTDSTVSGGTGDVGADLYLLGSATVDAVSVTGTMYVAPAADLDTVSGALVTDTATGEAVLYATVAEAATAYTEGDSIKLYESCTLTLDCDAVVDINGKTVAITGNGATKITAFDSANSDFATYGELTLTDAALANGFETVAIDGNKYYTLSSDGAYSFHRFEMEITGVSFRTTTGGIYFKGVWNCDDALKAQIDSFGVAVSVLGMPGADFAQSEHCLWTEMDADLLESGKEINGALVDGIIKKDRAPDLNDGYGRNYAICAATYVVFKNGVTLVSDDPTTDADDVAVTLYDVVGGIEEMITALEASESEADQLLAQQYLQRMDAFYAEWKDYGLESWGREDFTEPGN